MDAPAQRPDGAGVVMAANDYLAGVRGRVRQAVARNAASLANLGSAGPLTVADRAERWWDVPAKVSVAEAIADDELKRAGTAHNNLGDAKRHARWSQRTAAAAGPVFAEIAGLAHEAKNLKKAFGDNLEQRRHPERFKDAPRSSMGQIASESLMDLRNNAEGRRAAIEGRGIRRENLQAAPSHVAPYDILYDQPPPRRLGVPPR
jgi:hypothetical protein